jgi:hypothetical protein
LTKQKFFAIISSENKRKEVCIMYIYLLERDYHEGFYSKSTKMAFSSEKAAYDEAMGDTGCDSWRITELELQRGLEEED